VRKLIKDYPTIYVLLFVYLLLWVRVPVYLLKLELCLFCLRVIMAFTLSSGCFYCVLYAHCLNTEC
jgi:hypothetical protein